MGEKWGGGLLGAHSPTKFYARGQYSQKILQQQEYDSGICNSPINEEAIWLISFKNTPTSSRQLSVCVFSLDLDSDNIGEVSEDERNRSLGTRLTKVLQATSNQQHCTKRLIVEVLFNTHS